MNRLLLLLAIAASATLFSFGKAEQAKKKTNATIVRDCTGTYIRLQSGDYLVCNKDFLASVPDNSMAEVKFKTAGKCPPTDEMVCMMYHEHKGVVEITKVKWSGGEVTKGKK